MLGSILAVLNKMKNTLINDIAPAVYDGWDAINYSSLKKFMVSPKHYKNWIETKDNEEPNDALRFGTAVHMMCLQPQHFSDRFIISPICDRRTKEGKQVWSEFQEQSASYGNNWLKEDEAISCKQISNAVLSNPFFNTLNDKHFEVYREAGFLTEFGGIEVKGRIDLYNKTNNVIVDIKTISDTP